jgi:hypothetical protein
MLRRPRRHIVVILLSSVLMFGSILIRSIARENFSLEQPHMHVESTQPTHRLDNASRSSGAGGAGTLEIRVSDSVAVSDEGLLNLA